MGLNLVDMVSKTTALRVMVQLLSGAHVLNPSLDMDIHQEGLHLRTCHTPNLMVAIRSSHHQEVAWAGIRGRALHPMLPTMVAVTTTINRVLNHMKASHQITLLGLETTIVMGHHRAQIMDNLSIRSLHLHRTMGLVMVILDTMLQHQTSSTMDSLQRVHSKATLHSKIPTLGLMVDLDNGHPEVHQPEMALTRRHHLHLMAHHLSSLLLMVRHMGQRLDLMGILSRVTHSKVHKRQQHMVRVHQQGQGMLNKAHSKVAMHSILNPNQHMVIKQLKTMQTTATRVLQQIPTMEMPTHRQDTVLLRLVARLDMLLHRLLASQGTVSQDTLSHLQIHQLMISLPSHQLRVAMLHLLQTHSLLLQRGCHRSLLDMVDNGPLEVCTSLLTAMI